MDQLLVYRMIMLFALTASVDCMIPTGPEQTQDETGLTNNLISMRAERRQEAKIVAYSDLYHIYENVIMDKVVAEIHMQLLDIEVEKFLLVEISAFIRLIREFTQRFMTDTRVVDFWNEEIKKQSLFDTEEPRFGRSNLQIEQLFLQVLHFHKVNLNYDNPWFGAFVNGSGFCSELRHPASQPEEIRPDDYRQILFGKLGYLLYIIAKRKIHIMMNNRFVRGLAKLSAACTTFRKYPIDDLRYSRILSALVKPITENDVRKPFDVLMPSKIDLCNNLIRTTEAETPEKRLRKFSDRFRQKEFRQTLLNRCLSLLENIWSLHYFKPKWEVYKGCMINRWSEEIGRYVAWTLKETGDSFGSHYKALSALLAASGKDKSSADSSILGLNSVQVESIKECANPRIDQRLDLILKQRIDGVPYVKAAYERGEGFCQLFDSRPFIKVHKQLNKILPLMHNDIEDLESKEWHKTPMLKTMYLHFVCENLRKQPIAKGDRKRPNLGKSVENLRKIYQKIKTIGSSQ